MSTNLRTTLITFKWWTEAVYLLITQLVLATQLSVCLIN